MIQRKDLFDFMQMQVKNTADANGDRMPQAFARWFANMYFRGVSNVAIPDGAGDGKVDALITCQTGKTVHYGILNSKFTAQYDHSSPVSFYDEITRYWQAFENKENRAAYLGGVRESLRPHFKKLFRHYDEGLAKLYFITNHRRNETQYPTVKNYDVTLLHLDDVLQYVAEHIEGAMPETPPLLLTGISNVLTPPTNESEVPTSIVFARLIDFINYMEEDPFDLLFARNVRLWLGTTETNKSIQNTFRDAPKEFAYSNNGITILCKKHTHDPGKQELLLQNPRVVNGSQTLHSVRTVDNPSKLARAMVRIIEVPTGGSHELPAHLEKRKDIIHKISIRSNLQNPIRQWNLVANDDFQNDLHRYFWDKRLYYERRQREWKFRKLELSSVGIRRGPDIRWMTQLIAAYHHDRRKLGPATAQGRLNGLFEEEPYSVIRETKPQLAYQLYLLGEILTRSLRYLAGKKVYIRNVRGYADLSLFSYVCRLLDHSGVVLGADTTTKAFEEQYAGDDRLWEQIVKEVIDLIVADFGKSSDRAERQEDVTLTPANYFKNSSYIGALVASPIPRHLRALGSRLADKMEA